MLITILIVIVFMVVFCVVRKDVTDGRQLRHDAGARKAAAKAKKKYGNQLMNDDDIL